MKQQKPTHSFVVATLSILAASLAWAGTEDMSGSASPSSGEEKNRGPGMPHKTAVSERPSDHQITEIVRSAHRNEIEQAELARKNSRNPEVLRFAQTMLQDHQASYDQVRKLSRNERLKPQASNPSRELKDKGQQTLAELKEKTGKDFDRAYMEAQVKQHERVLDSIDRTLLPNSRDLKLKAMLQKTRASVATHLEHAKKLRSELDAG